MLPIFRSRLLAGAGTVAVLALASGCRESPGKVADASAGGQAATSAGAAGANDAASGATDVASDGGAPSNAGAAGAADSAYAGSGGDGCRSGQTRCLGQLGYQRCTPDGVWGASESCGGYSENGTSSYCGTIDDGSGPWAACIDPACWWWLQSGTALSDERAGVCVAPDKVRPCVGGFLTEPVACDGRCRPVSELDGRAIGYCHPGCAEGERECLGGALYRECVAGRWSSQARSCADGEPCQPLSSGPRSDIKCGGACEAGTSRCSLDGASVEHCTDAKQWEGGAPCMLGRCVASAAQAQCQTECEPDERACAYDGAPSERVCNERGLWNEPTACAAGSTCRVGSAGSQGCLKCVGSSVPGGNVWGVTDSHCVDGVAECTDGNDYAASTPCPQGQSCSELTRGAATLAYCE